MRVVKLLAMFLVASMVLVGCGGGGGSSSNETAADGTKKTVEVVTEAEEDKNKDKEDTAEDTKDDAEDTAEDTKDDVEDTVKDDDSSSSSSSSSQVGSNTSGIIINHSTDTIGSIPAEYINRAKQNLHIIYQGASHSRQMSRGLVAFEGASGITGRKGDIYGVDLSGNGASGKLDMKENFGGYWSSITNAASLYSSTSSYLDAHSKVNVVFWMWCYQRDDWNGAGTEYETNIDTYINAMEKLISEYGEGGSKVSSSRPAVTFVYATGPNMKDKDGTAENENLTVFNYNKRIRDHAKAHNRVLFDYNDIESYSPEEVYYGDGDKSASDVYSNYTHANDLQDNNYGFGDNRKNWALAWQENHTENVDYFKFDSTVKGTGGIEHSNAIDADRKVYAMWWLYARLAGWNGQ